MLPPELWAVACRFLDNKNLARVSCTSSTFLIAARPILYQYICLRSNKYGTQATFDLIKSNTPLAHEVKHIHIMTEWKNEDEAKSWLDLAALSNLAQLQSMVMTASPFRTAGEQATFLDILKRSCPYLKEFTYRQCRYASPPFLPSPHPTTFPNDDFQIYGLEKVVWDDNACFSTAQPQLRSLMNASLPTISHLALPSPLDSFGVTDSVTFYEQFKFPCLRTFEIGDWTGFNGEAGPVALVEFLITHPTIQELSLNWEDTSEYTPELSDSVVTPTMLPNLRSLHSHVFNVLVLLQAGVRVLRNLTRLSVGHGLHPDAESQIDEMLEGLISNEGLPNLKTLHFDPGESCSDPQKTHQWISQWSQICPGLEEWSGTLPDMELDALISDFSHFPGLMKFGLAYTTVPRGIDDVATIASHLSSLRQVTIQPTREFNIRRITYHVERNDLKAAVSKLVIRKYNLCNFQVTTNYHNPVV